MSEGWSLDANTIATFSKSFSPQAAVKIQSHFAEDVAQARTVPSVFRKNPNRFAQNSNNFLLWHIKDVSVPASNFPEKHQKQIEIPLDPGPEWHRWQTNKGL